MEQAAKETISISLEDEMRRSYLDYAMSVIVGRALPDVRDGLKPVHRRVLFAMYELNNDWNRAFKKSARIVGDVIGPSDVGSSAAWSAVKDALPRPPRGAGVKLTDEGNGGEKLVEFLVEKRLA